LYDLSHYQNKKITMYQFEFPYRVTYADTDKMGYLYYGNYAKLYEIGRVETLRSLGLSYKDMEESHKVMLPVVSCEARYLQPATYDELLTIRTIIPELPSKMIVFQNEILNEKQFCIHKAVVKLFFVDMISGGRISCPEWLINALKPGF
jgi:acyl-CoA thioester hydrolase